MANRRDGEREGENVLASGRSYAVPLDKTEVDLLSALAR